MGCRRCNWHLSCCTKQSPPSFNSLKMQTENQSLILTGRPECQEISSLVRPESIMQFFEVLKFILSFKRYFPLKATLLKQGGLSRGGPVRRAPGSNSQGLKNTCLQLFYKRQTILLCVRLSNMILFVLRHVLFSGISHS